MIRKSGASSIVALLLVIMTVVGCQKKTILDNSGPSTDVAAMEEPASVSEENLTNLVETDSISEIVRLANETIVADESLASELVVESPGRMTQPVARIADVSPELIEPASTEADVQPEFDLQGDPVRIYLPTASGPLILDVLIHLDGRYQDEVFHEQIDKVIVDAKGDSDEVLDWPRLFEFVRGNPQRFGTIMLNVGNNTAELIRRTDTNRNRLVDHDELVRFLFRNHRENVALRVRGTDYFRSFGRAKFDLFESLDTDGDRVLDDTEIEDAAASIFRLDQNSDRQIEFDEIGIEPIKDDDVWDRRRSGRHGDVAMDLDGFVDWTLVSYSLAAMRAQMPLGLPENVVDSLDTNGDANISGNEAKGLLSCDPHLSLWVEFSSDDSPAIHVISAMPTVWDRLIADEVKKDQITILDDRLQLTIRVVDRTYQSNQIPEQAFRQLDTNVDGYLDESEIPQQAAESFSFDVLDADGDEKLTLSEINQPANREVPIWAYQVRGRAAETQDQLFGFLDLDHDQSLSTREINAAAKHLRSLLPDSDFLRPADIPETYVLALVRGDPAEDTQAFNEPTPTTTKIPLPPWAAQMDVNKDGEISRREFLGNEAQFTQLDQNGDGFVDDRESKLGE